MSILPDADSFKRLVDGATGGPVAAAARLALGLLEAPYSLAVRGRNAAYDLGLLPVHPCTAPVICIGNLTLGGTGKTPLVAWVARRLHQLGMRPAIVSRGYGSRAGERSDEAAELGLLLPDVPHVANRDRVAAARTAVVAGAGAVVLDDGFQHRRLARDVDIITVDATDPYGCGRIFPRGLLREPLTGVGRADAVVLTRATHVDAARRAEIRAALAAQCRGAMPPVWAEAVHRPVALRQAGGGRLPLESIAACRLVAFAGIGNPAAFRDSLRSIGGDPRGFHGFPDHHRYSRTDIAELGNWARRENATMVVTTLKDLVKIGQDRLDGIPLAAVEIAIDFSNGRDEIEELVGSVATTSSFRREACASAAGASTS